MLARPGPLFSPLQLPAALAALALGSPTDVIPPARRPCRRGPPSPLPEPPLPPRWSAAALTVGPASAAGDRPPPPSPAAPGPSPPSRMRPPPRMRWRRPPPLPRPLHPATTSVAALRSRRPWRPVRPCNLAAAAAATGVARTTMTTTTPAAGAPRATVRCRPRTQLPSRPWGAGCQSRYPLRPRARAMAATWCRWRRRWRGASRQGRPLMRPPRMEGVARRRPLLGARASRRGLPSARLCATLARPPHLPSRRRQAARRGPFGAAAPAAVTPPPPPSCASSLVALA